MTPPRSAIRDASAASAAGHSDELATSGRVRERYLNRLVRALLAGEPEHRLAEAADLAGWRPPATLAAALLPTGHASRAVTNLDGRALRADELPGGTLIASCSRHMVAVIDGVIRDTHDPSRGGTRCVYGYYIRA